MPITLGERKVIEGKAPLAFRAQRYADMFVGPWDTRPNREIGMSDYQACMANLLIPDTVSRDELGIRPEHFEAFADARDMRDHLVSWANDRAKRGDGTVEFAAVLSRYLLPSLAAAFLREAMPPGEELPAHAGWGKVRFVIGSGILDTEGQMQGRMFIMGEPLGMEPMVYVQRTATLHSIGLTFDHFSPDVELAFAVDSAVYAKASGTPFPSAMVLGQKVERLVEMEFIPSPTAVAGFGIVNDFWGVDKIVRFATSLRAAAYKNEE